MAVVTLAVVGGFIYIGATSLVKAQDEKLRYEQKLQNKSLDVKNLETKEDKLEKERVKAEQDKALQEKQLQESQKQQQELLEKQKQLEAQLQAKLDTKNTVTLASANTTSVATSAYPRLSNTELASIITRAANRYGINPSEALRVASCESTGATGHYDNTTVNENYAEIAGAYPSGLFQHLANYWPARAAKHGYAGASVFDAEANANVTMAMWAQDNAKGLWECQ